MKIFLLHFDFISSYIYKALRFLTVFLEIMRNLKINSVFMNLLKNHRMAHPLNLNITY